MDNEANNIGIKDVPVEKITTEEIEEKPKTKIVEEIVTDATGFPKLIRKEVLVEEENEPLPTPLEKTKKKKGKLFIFILLLLVCGGLYYYFFILKKDEVKIEDNKKTEIINVIDEPTLNKDDYYIYFKRDTGVVFFSQTYFKAYKLLATYKCVSINKCNGVDGNKHYALIKDDNDYVLYNLTNNTSKVLSNDYSKYNIAKFKIDKNGIVKGINFSLDDNNKFYEIKEG